MAKFRNKLGVFPGRFHWTIRNNIFCDIVDIWPHVCMFGPVGSKYFICFLAQKKISGIHVFCMNSFASLSVSKKYGAYESGNKISLNDLKGKVVLLTFWFPGCGPCRAEFPHLESVMKKFSTDKIVYIGVNGLPDEDDYVIPFMKSTGYSFTPVRGDFNQDLKNLAGMGYPRNYLIDKNGRIIASKFFINKNNERMLELLISELLTVNID